MCEQKTVLGWRGTGLEVSEEGLLRTEHLNGARGQPCQSVASARAHGKASRQHWPDKTAEARKVLLGQGSQSGFKTIETGLNLHGGRAVVPQAAPLGTRGHVERGAQVETARESTQIVRLAQRPCSAEAIVIQIEVWKKQAKPFNQARKAHVARLAHLFHRPMEVLQPTVQIPGCIGHPTFCKPDGRLIEEGEVFCPQLGQLSLANRLDHGFRKAFEQLRCFRRQPALSDAFQPLNGALHTTAAGPTKSIDLHVVLIDEDRDEPIVEKAHVATSRP